MTKPRPVVALLGAASGARQMLARALVERLVQAGIGAESAPEFVFELPSSRKAPALTLLLAPDAGTHDTGLRERLAQQGIGYSVLHGDALAGAWPLLQQLLALPAESAPEPARRAWSWACDKCSDPVCEHRLFRDLMAGKAGGPGTDRAP